VAAPASCRPIILGAEGLLGRTLARRLERDCAEVIAATRAEIDITDRFRLEAELERLLPTVVVNCAAWTDVDGCTRDPDRAMEVNGEGAGNVARAAAGTGCRVVHMSTDFVFDGRAGRPYTESDPPLPLSEYGRSKLEGEKQVAAAAPDHLIVRTAWVYGPSDATFVEKIRRLAAGGGGPLRVVDDQRGSPTFVEDLAEGIVRLLPIEHRGLVHVVNTGVCSRYELAAAVLEETGLAGRVGLEATTTRPKDGVAPRPAFAALDTTLFSRLTGAPLRPWREALRAYLGHAARTGDMPCGS
jgi:dTDP-4-dehydrorhamnose reductase